MSEKKWLKVDNFFEKILFDKNPVMDKVLENINKSGLPEIYISPCQGQMLQIFAMMIKAKRILEIGTLGGYSTIWLAGALPDDGLVVTLEFEDKHADVAEENFRFTGISDKVKLIRGAAENSLERMVEKGEKPFDMIFIDADKPNNPLYLDYALKLSKPGTVIISDNVVWEGGILDASSNDPKVLGLRKFITNLNDERIKSTAIQTVGVKGYDGFSISIVK